MTDAIPVPDFPDYTIDASGRIFGKTKTPLTFDINGRVSLRRRGRVIKVFPCDILCMLLQSKHKADLASTVSMYESRTATLRQEVDELRDLVIKREQQRDAIAAVKLAEVATFAKKAARPVSTSKKGKASHV